jgi:hypothetical protein
VKVQGPATDLKIGWCLSPSDLAVAKLVAGRPKDLEFVAVMLRESLVDRTQLSDALQAIRRTDSRLSQQVCDDRLRWLQSAGFDQDRPRQT